eukprot:CCRYP_005732-RA/>CCRYP_005732-RA protein AED:0.27 eAED:0.19 QI:0/-1/0/1/-1/0/1/0/441
MPPISVITWLKTTPAHLHNFFILYKINKPKKPNGQWHTRPVTSDVTSYPRGLGKWVNQELQPLACKQASFFKDSFELKTIISELSVHPSARLFTADTTSVYTNIKTDVALTLISQLIHQELSKPQQPSYTEALVSALHIVFTNSIVKFGDTYWRQTLGTGMGIAPAPPWATIFYILHEPHFVPKWSTHLIFYKRFIDDIIGIWLPHPDMDTDTSLWSVFCNDLQQWQWHGLEWTVSPRSTRCNFMDLALTLTPTGKIDTNLFEKSQNLYLYIPPGSAHPKGMIKGLIFGNNLCIMHLCSHEDDITTHLANFKTRLLTRGYPHSLLEPLFLQAVKHAKAFITNQGRDHPTQPLPHNTSTKIFLHLEFHPEDPKPQAIHRLWQEYVSEPEGKRPLQDMCNSFKEKVNLDRLTLAYSRPPNLRNRFSVCDISGRGQDVSSYLVE